MTEAGSRKGVLESFVGIDLETTGIHPGDDRIIEVAAVRVVGGEVADRFESLVDPGCPIPSDVVHLTGITDRDVKGARPIGEVLPLLIEFVGETPVVAHQASFDVAFLSEAAPDGEFGVGSGEVYDTLALSRALIPRLPNHRLTTVASFFDIDSGRAHRAGDDALTVARVLMKLLQVLDEVGPSILEKMSGLADPMTSKLIRAARARAVGRLEPSALPDFGPKSGELLRYDNARRTDIPRIPHEERVGLDAAELEALFEEGGKIARKLAGYEPRSEQLEMMKAVADALTGAIHLAVEAGTGVGKSLAYLVPSVYWAVANGERVIVSTRTRNLQDQLFLRDIPFLEVALDVDFSAALLKGRGNYLCLNRWHHVLERGLSPSERVELLPLAIWEEETNSGDIAENAAFRRRAYLWSRISADGGACEGAKCPYHDRCYLVKARRASQSAHIVIVNHALLFSDTEAENRILGEYSCLVCDEAHNIEAVATEHLGKRVSAWRARALLDNLYRKDTVESGVIPNLLSGLKDDGEGGIAEMIVAAADRLKSDVELAQASVSALFKALVSHWTELSTGEAVGFRRIRYRPDGSVRDLLPEEHGAACRALSAAAATAESLADLVSDSGYEGSDTLFQNLEYHAGRLIELASDTEFLAKAEDAGSVFWLEVRDIRGSPECELRSAPISIAEMMDAFLYARVDSLVLTSATMTVDSSFDFVMERLGLDLLPDWKVAVLDVGSPYDYDAQTTAVVAGYLPAPSSPGFNALVGDLLVKLAAEARGGTLVLFTSKSSLNAVFRIVRGPLTSLGKLVLAQGHSGGSSAILGQFEKEVDSILLATASFWEGVDVPGRSLEQLIIAKLPFPVPNDPVVAAHCELYEASGEYPFSRYMVPMTAIRLRQGFGRLIRSTSDSGVVVLLDSRLETKRRSYGGRLLDQLPTEATVARSEEELLRVVGVTGAAAALPPPTRR